MVVLLAALGAERLLETLLFALHLDARARWAVWAICGPALPLGAAVIGAKRCGGINGIAKLGIRPPRAADIAIGVPVGIALFFGTMWLQNLISEHLSSWVSWYARNGASNIDVQHGPWLVINASQILTVPIGEESLFRGFVHRGLRTRFSMIPSIAMSAAVFAFIHSNPAIMLGIFIDGAVLAFALERRRTLAMPIVIHATILFCFWVQGFVR